MTLMTRVPSRYGQQITKLVCSPSGVYLHSLEISSLNHSGLGKKNHHQNLILSCGGATMGLFRNPMKCFPFVSWQPYSHISDVESCVLPGPYDSKFGTKTVHKYSPVRNKYVCDNMITMTYGLLRATDTKS